MTAGARAPVAQPFRAGVPNAATALGWRAARRPLAGLKACATSGRRQFLTVLFLCVLYLGSAMPIARTVGQPAASPRRIVSLVPATTEMLFAMGAGDRIA